ncbi:MAG: hypothetical protein GY943_19730 [Chloroflexi bacterium]|nr:hypothetical protein [Chloroflexota bacterium]
MNAYQTLDPKRLRKAVHKGLKAWHNQNGAAEDLLDFLLIIREQRRTMDVEHLPTQWRLATNAVLLEALKRLDTQNQTQTQVIKYRFLENDSVVRVCNRINVAEATVMRMQRAGVDGLRDILFTWETEARMARTNELSGHLPPSTYTSLFGVTDIAEELRTRLLADGEKWVLAIVGLGGIGKTSLADFVTRQVIQAFQYDDVAWVRMDPDGTSRYDTNPEIAYELLITKLADYFFGQNSDPRFEQRQIQVRRRLQARPHLVVIDNLESEADIAYLLDRLHDLANPTRFLITSRARPESGAGVFSLSLDELAVDDATDLMRHHAQEIHVEVVADASNQDLADVYEIVGGNPQALKLVVSLLDLLPLSQLMENLKESRPGKIEAMYKHIYWAAWNTLSEEARQLLKIMPLVSETGGDTSYLQMLSGLSAAAYWPALQQLRRRSLLEVRGGLQEKQYGIHRLTETFVRTEIANWQDEEDQDAESPSAG